jgi:anti-sigma factor ChrR (cupin superfamily)
MIFCPKYGTWIHKEECEKDSECYDLVNWDDCILLKREVKRLGNSLIRIKEASE